jgi:hypothetical protein
MKTNIKKPAGSYPREDRRGRKGSTLGKAWGKYWTKVVKAQSRRLTKSSRDYQRARQSLIARADSNRAKRLTQEARDEWHKRNLPALVRGSNAVMSKDAARTKLTRSLVRSIPGFRRVQALKRSHLQNHRKLTSEVLGTSADGTELAWNADLTGIPGDKFVPPFPEFDLHTDQFREVIVEDHSQVLPDIGHLVQNYVFEHNESDWGFYNPAQFASHLASCGVQFTMPQAGRLHVTADIQNFFNRLDFSVSDNFGYSHSDLEVRVSIFVLFRRGGDLFSFYPIELMTTGVFSDGDDLSKVVSDLDNSVAYAADITTIEIFPAGESLRVLAGSQIRIDSDTDDMDVQVKATFWWQLRALYIDVVA